MEHVTGDTDTAAERELSGRSGPAALLRAALPSIPVLGSLLRRPAADLSGLAAVRRPTTPTRDHVDAYAQICGYPRRDTLPLTYPHLLGFGLQLALMSDPAFPAPAIGLVHIENSLVRHRQIRLGEELSTRVAVGQPRRHPAGTAYEFTTQLRADDEPVWESVSTYLRRGPRDPEATWPTTLADAPASGTVVPAPADLGRRYARVSGDYNPIHLSPLSAKALGFRRQIAHGMWTLARSVAALENRLPDRVRVDAAFRRPAYLPTMLAFGSTATADGFDFSLHSADDDTLHLLGRATVL
ncbi:MAG: MaoC/PaaZ C-terminal domain-containing protein [Nocardioides sp.]|uniref:MaoC/PaaZ C-terminal domain-containing protein n=1 Tax=Nocardioides sp. TaxID=35761 RepID=UPI0039E66847